jgi:hypothetical protein
LVDVLEFPVHAGYANLTSKVPFGILLVFNVFVFLALFAIELLDESYLL